MQDPNRFELVLPADIAFDLEALKKYVDQELSSKYKGMRVEPFRRSVDARGKKVLVRVLFDVVSPTAPILSWSKDRLPYVSNQKPVVVVGAGPAGYFAAIKLIELGKKPIVLERGKDVRARRFDLAAIQKHQTVHPESNYCFGEGGAGTYSDGKLYTRSTKRGDIRRILEIFVDHGASEDILIDAHPHIGTNKLPKIISSMRDTIVAHGGEVHFDAKVVDVLIKDSSIQGVTLANGDKIDASALILATGHSARDVFELLDRKKIYIEPKPFALGVRVEHQQSLIDSIQYHCAERDKWLPASSYSLVTQVGDKKSPTGVFSFCMCPGGFMVPSATAPGEVVVNGMSPSKRDSKFSNSGIVVQVDQADFAKYAAKGALAGMYFQQEIEQKACAVGGGTQVAPAQRLNDFIQSKTSSSLPECSYQPGLLSVDMRQVLPSRISEALKFGFKDFGKKMDGYITNDAIIVGVESRTSSPVRIPRDPVTLEHVQIKGLYPCGEGAGFAGGIVSAAMDGERCAEMAGELKS